MHIRFRKQPGRKQSFLPGFRVRMPSVKHFVSKNEKDTRTVAKEILDEIMKDGKERSRALVVALSGNLGSGKTAFTKAAARNLGIKSRITSPTFVIMKRHSFSAGKGSKEFKFFFHIDAYRLRNEKEILSLGWKEISDDKNNLIFIEWPENIQKVLPRGARRISVSADKTGARHFKFK